MFAYISRRILYAIPILIGVNLLTFALYFLVNSPDDMARMHLGTKHITQQGIDKWKSERGYDKPLFYNEAQNSYKKVSDTIFYDKSVKLFLLDFGNADNGRNIGFDIGQRMWPSLAYALPVFLLGMIVYISFSLLLVFFRATYVDLWGVVLCVVMMSISGIIYIIAGQYLVGKILLLVPISGYEPGITAYKFLILPILIGIVSGLGSSSRWYRTIFLEEINRDYVRTARAKGLSELRVLFAHVLKNAMIPILTGAVVAIPLLFMGSLLMESFFGIPGLGSYTIDAIRSQDFAIVRAMVFLGSILYIIGLVLTDISYTLVDPRVRLS